MSARVSKRKKAAAAAAAIAIHAGADDGDDTTVQEDEEEATATLDDTNNNEGSSNKRAKPLDVVVVVKEEDNEAAAAAAPLAVVVEEAASLAHGEDAAAPAGDSTAPAVAVTDPPADDVLMEVVAVAAAAAALPVNNNDDDDAAAIAAAAAAVEQPDENGPELGRKPNSIPVPSRAKPKLKSRNSSTSESVVPTPTRKLNTNFPSHLNATDMADFDHFLFQLLASRAENSLSNFTIHKDEYPLLYAWMQFLKKEYKAFTTDGDVSQLTAQQVSVLEYLHVPLTSRGDDHWNRFFDLLVAYKERHGHVLVPRLCEIPGLGDWVTDQRRQYKAKQQGQATQLTDPRQEKLDSIDFVWHVRNRPEWDLRYAELLEYKQEHGDCKVPQHYKPNKALGKWVAKQREQYKLLQKKQHSFLTPYRQEKLNTAGFVWVVRAGMEGDMRHMKSEAMDSEDVNTTTTNGAAVNNNNTISAMEQLSTVAVGTAEPVNDELIKPDPDSMEQDEKDVEKEVYNV